MGNLSKIWIWIWIFFFLEIITRKDFYVPKQAFHA